MEYTFRHVQGPLASRRRVVCQGPAPPLQLFSVW